MKKMIMALIAILAICGAAGGGYFYFKKPPEAVASEDEASKAAKAYAAKKASKEEGGDEHDAKNEYVALDPLVLPIIDEDGISQTISVVVSIEVAGKRAADTVRDMRPKLADAYIENMYGMLNRYVALRGGVLQIGLIKEKLYEVTYQVLGKDGFEDVLLQVVEQRKN